MSTLNFLAFDTSTDMMSVAVGRGDQSWHHHGLGGANASAQLLPVIQNLLDQAGLQLSDLTALVMGQGPGSFTGLRTACAVAQGLAMGAQLKVIAVDTLMVVAEDARLTWASTSFTQTRPDHNLRVGVVMDARMSEVYAGTYEWHAQEGLWHTVSALEVGSPAVIAPRMNAGAHANFVLAGNGFEVYKDRWPLVASSISDPSSQPVPCVPAVPHALALLRLAPALWQQGVAVLPEHVQPLYIRDKVAQTTAEREALKGAMQQGGSSA